MIEPSLTNFVKWCEPGNQASMEMVNKHILYVVNESSITVILK